MKKIKWLYIIALLFVFSSCKKEQLTNHEQESVKTNELIDGKKIENIITEQGQSDIEKLFPGFKFKTGLEIIDISTYGFDTRADLIKNLELIKKNFDNYFSNKKVTIEAAISEIVANSASDTTTLPTVTVIAQNIASGGLFSSFTLTFNYGSLGISGQSLSLMGGTVGWWWNSGYSTTTGLNSGYTNGTATYFYGLGTYSIPYTLNYTYNPIAHTLTYHWNSGLSPTP